MSSSRPYEPLGMTTAKWCEVPVIVVQIKDLVFTNPVDFNAVVRILVERDEYRSHTGDPWPLVVEHEGKMYLEDGNARVAASVLRGCTHTHARVLTEEMRRDQVGGRDREQGWLVGSDGPSGRP